MYFAFKYKIVSWDLLFLAKTIVILELSVISQLTTVCGRSLTPDLTVPLKHETTKLLLLGKEINDFMQNETSSEPLEPSEQPAGSSQEQNKFFVKLKENTTVPIEQPVSGPGEHYLTELQEESSTIKTMDKKTAPSTKPKFNSTELNKLDIEKTNSSPKQDNSIVEKNIEVPEQMNNDKNLVHIFDRLSDSELKIIVKNLLEDKFQIQQSNHSEVVIGGGIAGFFVLLFFGISITWYCKRENMAQDPKTKDEECFGLDNFGFEKNGKNDQWTFNRDRLQFMDILGEGSYGRVYLAEALVQSEIGCKLRQKIAVKTTQMNAPESAQMDLLQELAIMKLIGTHLNVVKLIGACTEKVPIFVIMELHRESLIQFLRRARDDKEHMVTTNAASYRVSSKLLVGFALQIARGMQHLSSLGIIHRDLAARNILLSTDLVCKIADFGLAREVNDEEIYVRKTNLPLPIRWMAPESLTSDEASVRSDIWSYGVMLWEMVTLGATPYPGRRAQQVKDMVCSGERMEKPKTCAEELHELMMQCWEQEPEQRPDFTMCADILAGLLERDADYIKLEEFPEGEYFQLENAEEEKV